MLGEDASRSRIEEREVTLSEREPELLVRSAASARVLLPSSERDASDCDDSSAATQAARRPRAAATTTTANATAAIPYRRRSRPPLRSSAKPTSIRVDRASTGAGLRSGCCSSTSPAPPSTLPVSTRFTTSQYDPTQVPTSPASAAPPQRCRGCPARTTSASSGSAMNAVNFVPSARASATAPSASSARVEPTQEVRCGNEERGNDEVVERARALEHDHGHAEKRQRSEQRFASAKAQSTGDAVDAEAGRQSCRVLDEAHVPVVVRQEHREGGSDLGVRRIDIDPEHVRVRDYPMPCCWIQNAARARWYVSASQSFGGVKRARTAA